MSIHDLCNFVVLFFLFWLTPESVENLEAETGLSLSATIDLMGQAGSAATTAIAIDGTRMAIAVATLSRKSQPMLS